MWHQYKFIVVIALLGFASFLVTEKGKLPLALRGLRKIMRRDRNLPEEPEEKATHSSVSAWRRLLAFVLVLLALLLAV